MHEPNCSSLPGQQCVLSAVGVASHGCRAGDGAKSTEIRGKRVGQTLALPPSLTLSLTLSLALRLTLSLALALTLVLGGQRNARATTAARRACTCTCRAARTR